MEENPVVSEPDSKPRNKIVETLEQYATKAVQLSAVFVLLAYLTGLCFVFGTRLGSGPAFDVPAISSISNERLLAIGTFYWAVIFILIICFLAVWMFGFVIYDFLKSVSTRSRISSSEALNPFGKRSMMRVIEKLDRKDQKRNVFWNIALLILFILSLCFITSFVLMNRSSLYPQATILVIYSILFIVYLLTIAFVMLLCTVSSLSKRAGICFGLILVISLLLVSTVGAYRGRTFGSQVIEVTTIDAVHRIDRNSMLGLKYLGSDEKYQYFRYVKRVYSHEWINELIITNKDNVKTIRLINNPSLNL